MKTKRTGLDVLQQFQAAIRLAQTNPALVEKAMHSLTPEQLRKAHEGLAVLANCLASAAPPVAAALVPSASTPTPEKAAQPARAAPARQSEPATELA